MARLTRSAKGLITLMITTAREILRQGLAPLAADLGIAALALHRFEPVILRLKKRFE